jgi:hypothetical protein
MDFSTHGGAEPTLSVYRPGGYDIVEKVPSALNRDETSPEMNTPSVRVRLTGNCWSRSGGGGAEVPWNSTRPLMRAPALMVSASPRTSASPTASVVSAQRVGSFGTAGVDGPLGDPIMIVVLPDWMTVPCEGPPFSTTCLGTR